MGQSVEINRFGLACAFAVPYYSRKTCKVQRAMEIDSDMLLITWVIVYDLTEIGDELH